jgi:hypothetical protein
MDKNLRKKSFTSNKNEIIWNLINSGLAGMLVFLGACTNGNLNLKTIGIAILAALIIVVSKFKDYWTGEEKEYKNKCRNMMTLGSFI